MTAGEKVGSWAVVACVAAYACIGVAMAGFGPPQGGSGGGGTYTAGSGLLDTSSTFSVDINGQTADGAPDTAADYVMTYDADAGGLKKVLLDDLGAGGSSFSDVNEQLKFRSDHYVSWSDSTLNTTTEEVAIKRTAVGVLTITNSAFDKGALNIGLVNRATAQGDFCAGPTTTTNNLFFDASVPMLYMHNGSNQPNLALAPDQVDMASGGVVRWNSSAALAGPTGQDTGLARDSAGVVQVTDGSTGVGTILAKGLPRRLYVDTTTVGNITGGADNLMGYTIPSGTLAADDDEIIFRGSGTIASNGGNRTIQVTVDGTSLSSYIGAAWADGDDWTVEIRVTRISSTSVEVAIVTGISTTGRSFQRATEAVSDLASNTLVVQVLGEDSNSNTDEIQQMVLTADLWPAP